MVIYNLLIVDTKLQIKEHSFGDFSYPVMCVSELLSLGYFYPPSWFVFFDNLNNTIIAINTQYKIKRMHTILLDIH